VAATAAALLRRAPTVAGEEEAEAERLGASGCAVIFSIAIGFGLEMVRKQKGFVECMENFMDLIVEAPRRVYI
jgi:hypothetical protein